MVCDRLGGFVFLLVLRERSAGCKRTVRNCLLANANANGRLGLIGGQHIRELARGWTALMGKVVSPVEDAAEDSNRDVL